MSKTGTAHNNNPDEEPEKQAQEQPLLRDSFAQKETAMAFMLARAENDHLLQRLRALSDSEHGPIGQALHDRFRATGCRIEIDNEMKPLAVHTSFVYPPSKGQSSYENIVYLGTGATKSRERHFAALVHEATHATQTGYSSILHASPYNAATNIVMCPRDFVMACERAEQDAYARQAWLSALLIEKEGISDSFTNADPVSAKTFNTLRNETQSVTDAMRQAAVKMLSCPRFSSVRGDPVTLADSYHEMALLSYKNIMKRRAKGNAPALQFVRMEDRDILDIGRSYGPSLFGDNDQLLAAFKHPAQLSPHNQRLLDRLNKALGITDEASLPTFGAALAAQGRTRESFLADSRRPPGPVIQAAHAP
ncbi:MAG: hypothetical protein KJ667_05270 [Alphaproteobacteria bacterium]|nr:hypothetical protein [Alphaproteobacteria bacterium]